MPETYDTELAQRTHEFNSYIDYHVYDALFSCGVFTKFTEDDVKNVVDDPIGHYDLAIRIANYVYNRTVTFKHDEEIEIAQDNETV